MGAILAIAPGATIAQMPGASADQTEQAMQIALLLPAAGSSSRMRGADKLLQDVGGRPCLRALAERGLRAGAKVFVTLEPDRPARAAALDGLDVTRVPVSDARSGMAHSLRAGIAALPADVAAAMILPADMPEITADDMAAMMSAFRADPAAPILRGATADGMAGHPVIVPRDLFAGFSTLRGDRGAAALLGAHPDRVRLHRLPGRHARTDLDTPEDWIAWQDAQTRD